MARKKKEGDVDVGKTDEDLLEDAEDFLDRAETRGEDQGWHMPHSGHLALVSIAKSLLVIARRLVEKDTPSQDSVRMGKTRKPDLKTRHSKYEHPGRSDEGP